MCKLIFLIGFMGSGKTTLGRAVAHDLGITFLDLDEWIEQREGKTIKDIFANEGEAYFRQLESTMLKALRYLPDAHYLIATGGGTPCFEDNMQWMKSHGITIYLNPTSAELTKRLLPEKEKRPLLKETKDADIQQFIHKLLRKREVYYLQADHVFSGDKAETETLLELIKQQMSGNQAKD